MIQTVLKRDNTTVVDYNRAKIRNALEKANMEVLVDHQITDDEIEEIINHVENTCGEETNVETIQNTIENRLMFLRKFELAREYITYRYKRALVRKANTTDNSILALLQNKNREVQKENSNKKATINSTKRDLVAGEVSKDLTDRYLLPKHIVKAHKLGKLHFHK